MGLNGTYKISIEMSARKQVEGLLGTAKRLLGHVGIDNTPEPSDKEEHIQQVISMFKENQEVLDAVTLTINDEKITLRTMDGEMDYFIKEKTENDGQITLKLDSDELATVTWTGSLVNDIWIFDSEDELSEYAFEKQ
jgi:hypothetical protein